MLFVPISTQNILVLPMFNSTTKIIFGGDIDLGVVPANSMAIVTWDGDPSADIITYETERNGIPRTINNSRGPRLTFLQGSQCPKCAVVLKCFDGVVRYWDNQKLMEEHFPTVHGSVRNILLLFNPDERPVIDYL